MRRLTYSIIPIIGMMLCSELRAELGVVDTLLRFQNAEQKFGSQIIDAMVRNNLSKFGILKGQFENAPQPTIRMHHIEQVYRGACWTPASVESPEDASLSSFFIDKKIRLVPDFETIPFEIGSPILRGRYLERQRTLASTHLTNRSKAADPSYKKLVPDSWIISDSRNLSAISSVKERIAETGSGLLLQQICVTHEGCHPQVQFGDVLRLCEFISTVTEGEGAGPAPIKEAPKKIRATSPPTPNLPTRFKAPAGPKPPAGPSTVRPTNSRIK